MNQNDFWKEAFANNISHWSLVYKKTLCKLCAELEAEMLRKIRFLNYLQRNRPSRRSQQIRSFNICSPHASWRWSSPGRLRNCWRTWAWRSGQTLDDSWPSISHPPNVSVPGIDVVIKSYFFGNFGGKWATLYSNIWWHCPLKQNNRSLNWTKM